jgi:hypothetical protein
MYNPAIQVQVSTDANLDSYFFKKIKIAVGASPTAFPFKKKQTFKYFWSLRKLSDPIWSHWWVFIFGPRHTPFWMAQLK